MPQEPCTPSSAGDLTPSRRTSDSSLASPEKGAPPQWQESSQCDICGAALGKRNLNPRHHCRICGRSVCGACSPHSVRIDEMFAAQRACTRCIAVAQNVGQLRGRAAALADRLRAIHTGTEPCGLVPNGTLEEAIAACEAALTPVEGSHATCLEALQDATTSSIQLRGRLQALLCRLSVSSPLVEDELDSIRRRGSDLDEAGVHCQRALSLLEVAVGEQATRLEQAEAEAHRERNARMQLQECLARGAGAGARENMPLSASGQDGGSCRRCCVMM
eukprot:gnl/TRDRNA2_/TRDRNA2_85036_c0_seq1.p1 gnl/TRDRNA2_/TRDRNA2_85036_c0~~gnl/TRDRNA2_/TRDRNA2_85036_c0_seq1.p1  ORF type:complete len:275 (+),score=32.99 gnl/TRDRNA2_/TRDRNA2_85036_c0_seq1:69-893(+)